MREHTPTPWRVNGNTIWSNDGYVAELSCPRGPDTRDADAAFIVKAVNGHEALVKALKPFADYFDFLERNGYLEGHMLVSHQGDKILGHAGIQADDLRAARQALRDHAEITLSGEIAG